MMFKKSISFYFLNLAMFMVCSFTFSQSSEWMYYKDIDRLNFMDLSYEKPKKFKEIKGFHAFEKKSIFSNIIFTGTNKLVSNNNKVVIFSMLGDEPYQQDGANVVIAFSDTLSRHMAFIREDFWKSNYMDSKLETVKVNKGKNRGDSLRLLYEKQEKLRKEFVWKPYVNFYTKLDSKLKFNSDFAASYSLNLKPKDYYKGEYNNLWVLVFKRKKNNGYVRMYCFYKDMPKKKLEKYKAQVESVFHFE